jgi:hypothetical protein
MANVKSTLFVSDPGDRLNFFFMSCSFLLKQIFPFPLNPTNFISNFFDNRLTRRIVGLVIFSVDTEVFVRNGAN